MDKLNATQLADIKKLSSVRLCTLLTRAGVAVEQLEIMDRPSLLEAWAEIVVSGQDTAGASAASPLPAGQYDVDLERRKFAFEVAKYSEEKLERQRREEIEKRREDEERVERRRGEKVEQQRWGEEGAF